MRYLVDTNVFSELIKPAPQQQVIDWFVVHEEDCCTSPVVLGELEYGILILDTSRRRTRLMQWLDDLAEKIEVLPLDQAFARTWARLLTAQHKRGRPIPISDSLIAASALQHDLTLVTRNERHYRAVGADVLNPFAA